MASYQRLLRPLLFRLDPERAHHLALWFIQRGWVRCPALIDSRLEQVVFGVKFNNPVGLGAGFDKNAVAVDRWAGLGFGFAEVGTLTHHPQPGNPKPRLFRLSRDQALINRMGFNNDGAEAASHRLRRAAVGLPVGVNIGRSRAVANEQAATDCAAAYRHLAGLGQYTVVNVSSPNTPGLRDLHAKVSLLEMIRAMRDVSPQTPLLVKVSPDLDAAGLDDVIAVAHEERLEGLIATNTTVSRQGLHADPHETGGLSGRPLRQRADDVLRYLAERVSHEVALIGVGGIMTPQDAVRKIRLGAHLVQVYTGWVYHGPDFARRIQEAILSEIEREGVASVGELRGIDVKA